MADSDIISLKHNLDSRWYQWIIVRILHFMILDHTIHLLTLKDQFQEANTIILRPDEVFCLEVTILCGHVDKNDSNVFFTHGGHSDSERKDLSKSKVQIDISTQKSFSTILFDESTEGIVFIPNDKPVFRNEDIFNSLKVSDVVDKTQIGDIERDRNIKIEDKASPKEDILFISGKNDENIEKHSTFERKSDINKDSTIIRTAVKTSPTKRLNCKNLDCNSTVSSVCGGKEENKKWRYRLFLNDCFFRKVNCGFQHAINRFSMVSMDHCKNIAPHDSRPHYSSFIFERPVSRSKDNYIETRRSFVSRRSLNKGMEGRNCDHECPVSCTEEYKPLCAINENGSRKVFLNHCKLDLSSCLLKLAWRLRPLSECVGGRKADMTQNRGFIGWMQRAGIVDKRGKLVLS